MFGINFSEIILIFVIALLIFGPKQIPQIATQVGKFIYKIRIYVNKMKHDIYTESGLESGFNEIKNTRQELLNIYSGLRDEVRQQPKINKNDVFDQNILNDELLHNTPILFQPELDFDRQPELFDDIRQ